MILLKKILRGPIFDFFDRFQLSIFRQISTNFIDHLSILYKTPINYRFSDELWLKTLFLYNFDKLLIFWRISINYRFKVKFRQIVVFRLNVIFFDFLVYCWFSWEISINFSIWSNVGNFRFNVKFRPIVVFMSNFHRFINFLTNINKLIFWQISRKHRFS